MSTRPLEVEQTVAERLAGATVAHRDAQETARRCARVWRELVVEAVDSGMARKDVAALAGISSPRVQAIVIRQDTGD